jgi:ketosteroid isomerase-like protein
VVSHSTERDTNREVVRKYFESHGEARLALFADDGIKEIPFWSTDGKPRLLEGRAALRENFLRNAIVYTDWSWRDVSIFDTQDPAQFFVECHGGGTWKPTPDAEARGYANHYVMHFKLENAKIKHFREFFNPLLTAVATGGELQKIKVLPLD